MPKKLNPTEEKKPDLGAGQTREEAADFAPEDGIGGRIRAAREVRGWSQAAVATRAKVMDPKGQGISRTGLVGYEAGHSKPGAREIRILSQLLGVSPTWLIFGEDASHETALPSMETVRKNDLVSALRLGLAISVLKPHERSAFQSLVLSMAGRELGDLRLSALLTLAHYLAEPALRTLAESGTTDVGDTLTFLVERFGDGLSSNFGNKLKFSEDGDPLPESEWLYPDPKQKVGG